jgi:hypothetical protein
MSIIRVKRSGTSGSPASLAQGEMGYSFLAGTQSNGGDRLYIGTGTETLGAAANIEVIGGKYFTSKLSHVPGTLTNNAAVIVDGSGRVDTFSANTLYTLAVSANGSVGTAGQLLTSNGTTTYWSTVTGVTNIGQTSNSSAIALTSSTGTGTTLAAANSTTAGLLSADTQTIAGSKTFNSTITGSVSGNAGTATIFQTARNINSVSFNGSADITITAVNPNALTIGTGLSGTSYIGSAAVTIAIDSTVATLTGTQTFTNKTFTDSTTFFQDDLDNTKKLQFQLSSITTATTRTLTVQDDSGTLALTSNKLSVFAATTSSELAGVISDETGSGSLVFATSPTLTTPVLGIATATSINKVVFTAPASNATLTIADGKTATFSNTLTFTGTDASSVAFGAGGTVAYTGATLAQFAATSSSQLAGVISDETGSGSLVFATSPTLTTPTLGIASATSINKVAFTAPATSATLTIADGKTATINNTLTFTGTDASSVAFGTGGTVAYTSNKLSTFAATTSAELAGVISDETGSGVLVFATAPTFTTSIDSGATFTAFGSATALTAGYTGTLTSTTNLSTGVTVSANTKTINIGTGGASGSITNINFGSSTSGSTGTATFNNDVVISGNLTVNGTTTTVNSTTVTVDDINLELGSVASPTDATAAGGGITLKGATDKTISWSAANGWSSSEDFNIATGKVFKIAGTSVLSGTTLGSGVTGSSLTSVGTIGTGVWQGTLIGGTYGGTGVNNGAKTITIGGNVSTANSFTTSGNFALTLTQTAATSVTLPTSGTLVGSADTGTVTSTMIANNTIIDADINSAAAIAISKLAASTISGVSLGNNLNTLTFGTGLTAGGASYNGSAAITITAVTANNTVLGVASFDSTNFTVTTGAVSINTIDGGTY